MAEFGDTRLPERFWDKVIASPSGCWAWSGARTGLGYGTFGNPTRLAHRVSYDALRGDLPDRRTTGLVPDHLCRNPGCVNPAHLEAVPQRDNVRRGLRPEQMRLASPGAAKERAKTHCPQGHPYDEANTYRHKRGRGCRACMKVHNRGAVRRRAQRLREAKEAACCGA
jgi:hypothetical protein